MKNNDDEKNEGNGNNKEKKNGEINSNKNKLSMSSENFTIKSQDKNYPSMDDIDKYQSDDASNPKNFDIYKDYNKDAKNKKVAEEEAKNLDNYIRNFKNYNSAEDLINDFVNSVKSGTRKQALKSLGAIKALCDDLSKFNQYFLNNNKEFSVGKFGNIKNKNEYGQKLQEIFKDEKNGNKLAKDFAYKFPIWGIQLLDYIEKSNFAKRLMGERNKKLDEGMVHQKKDKNIFHRIYKGFVHFFTGKEGKNKTITKVNNLLKKYSEPWAIFWVNYCDPDDRLSKDALINDIDYICKLKDEEFVSKLEKLNGTPGFYDFFAEMNNPKSNSNKVYRESKMLVSSMISRINHTNSYNQALRFNIQKIIEQSGVKNISYSEERQYYTFDGKKVIERTTNNFFSANLSQVAGLSSES